MSEIYKAIMAVQQAAPSIDKTANNPFFKSKYADLPVIWKVIKPLMFAAGLVCSHTTFCEGEDDFIRTKIVHAKSGEFIESVTKIRLTKGTAQEYGSYITYMRRYDVGAMLGLVTDKEDDGNSATAAQSKPEPKPEPTEAQKWIADAIADIRQIDDAGLVGHWFDKTPMPKFVNKAQEAHLNKIAMKHRVELEEKELTNDPV